MEEKLHSKLEEQIYSKEQLLLSSKHRSDGESLEKAWKEGFL